MLRIVDDFLILSPISPRRVVVSEAKKLSLRKV